MRIWKVIDQLLKLIYICKINSISILKILINSPCSASYIIQHGIKSWPIWESEPRTFEWKYYEREICLILEGNATLITQENITYNIKPGDLVTFPKNLNCTWTINKRLRKHFRLGD